MVFTINQNNTQLKGKPMGGVDHSLPNPEHLRVPRESQVWWLTLVITALGRQRKRVKVGGQLSLYCKFQTNQAYIVKLCFKKVCV